MYQHDQGFCQENDVQENTTPQICNSIFKSLLQQYVVDDIWYRVGTAKTTMLIYLCLPLDAKTLSLVL